MKEEMMKRNFAKGRALDNLLEGIEKDARMESYSTSYDTQKAVMVFEKNANAIMRLAGRISAMDGEGKLLGLEEIQDLIYECEQAVEGAIDEVSRFEGKEREGGELQEGLVKYGRKVEK
jgi:hypothetical protein